MKKIIDGKIYNTQTANHIANWSNNLRNSDFSNLEETLYRTKKGQFFLFANGGAATWCAQRSGNGSWAGEALKLLSNDEALEWCEDRNICTDIVETVFTLAEG
jgi:hypothetical protein